MSARLREAVVPLYVLLCLLLGGSAQGVWTNLLLQLLALPMIGWALLGSADRLTRRARQLVALTAAVVLLGLLHLVPLPPELWTALPGRTLVSDGYRLLDEPLPWLPLSLSPHDSIATLLTLLPPVAVLLAMLRLKAYRAQWLVAAIVAGAVAGVLLGIMQVNSPELRSPWRLYRITNLGVATGFFANSNHMATLLVVTIPFLAALVSISRGADSGLQRQSGILLLAGGALPIALLGLGLNGSLAGFALALPVLIASSLIVIRVSRRGWRLLVPSAALLLVLGAAGAVYAVSASGLFDTDQARISINDRRTMGTVTLQAAADFAPVGTGVGTFREIYGTYEDPWALDRTYVNHAHNDYFEILLETGLPGAILVILFLLWWAKAVRKQWRSAMKDALARAATIATMAVLVHSLVDYPLRTAAIAVLFAACLAMIAQPPAARPVSGRKELWPARHLEVR